MFLQQNILLLIIHLVDTSDKIINPRRRKKEAIFVTLNLNTAIQPFHKAYDEVP